MFCFLPGSEVDAFALNCLNFLTLSPVVQYESELPSELLENSKKSELEKLQVCISVSCESVVIVNISPYIF